MPLRALFLLLVGCSLPVLARVLGGSMVNDLAVSARGVQITNAERVGTAKSESRAKSATIPEPSSPRTEAWRSIRESFALNADTEVWVQVPPAPGAQAPSSITMLHGMGSSWRGTCAQLSDWAERDGLLLVCPEGNVALGGGRADWTGEPSVRSAHVRAATAAALSALELSESATPRLLAGFSRGAFVARDVAMASRSGYRGLLLLGAAIKLDGEALRAKGIERVVLAAGDFDGAAPTMRRVRTKLCAEGLPAVFVSLGPVYHALPTDSARRLREATRWALGEKSTTKTCSRAERS